MLGATMRLSLPIYAVLLVTFALAFGAAAYFSDSEFVRAGVVIPLLGVLYQLTRDHAAYDRELLTQERSFQFTIGAASQMANLAFEKHAAFSEKYMGEVHEMLHQLWREGENEAVLQHATNLYKLREDFACWLTSSIDSELDKFESALRKLGANSHFVDTTAGHATYEVQRSRIIESNFKLFQEILGMEGELNEDHAVQSIMILPHDYGHTVKLLPQITSECNCQ
jgi:hypothetical protein